MGKENFLGKHPPIWWVRRTIAEGLVASHWWTLTPLNRPVPLPHGDTRVDRVKFCGECWAAFLWQGPHKPQHPASHSSPPPSASLEASHLGSLFSCMSLSEKEIWVDRFEVRLYKVLVIGHTHKSLHHKLRHQVGLLPHEAKVSRNSIATKDDIAHSRGPRGFDFLELPQPEWQGCLVALQMEAGSKGVSSG